MIYNALQTWAVSVGADATGSSDLAALVCRVATVVDPRGRNEKLYELKSSLETHLEKTQIELALSQLRALVQVDQANAEEVSVALDKCKKMEIPSDLAHELVSFQRRTMSHFVEQMKSTPRQSPAWDAECKFTNEVMLSIGRYEAVKALGQENATAWPEVHTFARSCIEFKENMATLLDGDTGGSQHECIWPALVAILRSQPSSLATRMQAWPACHLT